MSHSEAKIDVIITNHNFDEYLKQSIESVLNQETKFPIHLIIVDDGSSDGSKKIINDFSSIENVTAVFLEGVGLATAANIGVKKGKAPLLIRLDADDWFAPNALQTLFDMIQSGANFAFSAYNLTDEKGNFFGRRQQIMDHKLGGIEYSPLAAGALYKRELYEKVGGYNEELRWQEDFDFWLRIKEEVNPSYSSEGLYNYRQHFKSMSRNRIKRAQTRALVKKSHSSGKWPREIPVFISTALPFNYRVNESGCLEDISFLNNSNLLNNLIEKISKNSLLKIAGIQSSNEEVLKYGKSHLATGVQLILSEPGKTEDNLYDEILNNCDYEDLLILNPLYPFIQPWRWEEAFHTQNISGATSVIAHGESPIEPIEKLSNGINSKYSSDINNPPIHGRCYAFAYICCSISKNYGEHQAAVELLHDEAHLMKNIFEYEQIVLPEISKS